MPYEVALVEKLITSFKDKLPCYSGLPIEQLSVDKEFYENVNVLIQLHEMRLSALLRRLFSLLETIARAAQTSDQRQSGLFQQSQLLMLRVIAMGMFYHWHQIYASHGVNSDRALINLSGSSSEESSEDGAAAAVNGRGYNKGEFNLYYPAPLEEPVAKRAFSIASEYFRSWTSPHSVRLLADTVGNQARYMFMLRSTHTSQSSPLSASVMDIAIGTSMLQKFVRLCISEPTADMSLEIQDAAGAIFMFVSASNWNVAMQRAKSCLYLVLSRGDEVADLTDIRFLEYASMDVTRLAQIIDAFNDVFTRVKPAEQLKLAVVLRRAVWNFISRCAGTFIDMHLTMQRPPTNRIEPFMDNLRAIIDSHTRSNAHPAFYQLMIMLLMLCPDTLVLATEHAFEHGEAREDGCSKHIRCISRIHQYMTNRDVPEGIVLAAQELQRTASVLTVIPENNVSRLAEMFEADVNSVLLDSSNRLSPYREEPIEPKLLLMNTMSCIFQLNPEKALQVYLPRVTGPKAEPWMQLIFMYAVEGATPQKHYTKSIASVPMFNKMASKLILDLLRRNVDTIQTISEQQSAGAGAQARATTGYGRRIPGYSGNDGTSAGFNATKSICDMALNMASTGEKVSIVPPNEIAQRVQMVSKILQIVAQDPRTAIWGENEDSKFESMELIVGAISSCIQEPSIAIQRSAGLALRALFSPAIFSEWVQSADIAFATWTLSLQVIQGICRALVHSMVTSTLVQHRQLLEILFDMMVLSNSILELSSGAMGATVEMAEYPQFEVAFEVVVMLHLWADDLDITQLTQECIRLKTRGQQLMVDAGILVDPTLSNHRLYQELDTNDVKQAGVYSRLAQMRAIFRIIRKHMRPTAGAQAAWQETYKLWRQMLQVLLMREETARVPDNSPVERDNSSVVASNVSTTSVSIKDVKDEKKEQTSRRRNMFEKLTGQSNKLSMRSSSTSNSTGSSSNVGSGLSVGNPVQRTAGSTGSTHGTGSAGLAGGVGGQAGRDDNQSVGPLRSAGIIGPGTQLPAVIRTHTLTTNELRTQWRYCTGFLLAAGGACISDGPVAADRMGGGDTAELHSLLEHFIGECLKLIVSDDIQLRELAKEGLGNKTHPGIYMLFLDGCLLNMKRFMQPSGEVSVSESRTLFVSQCISIIESLIDRDVTDSLLQSSMNIDFSPVLLTMCKYLNAASVQSMNGALQERIRYTRMVDMFLQSSLRQAIAQEVNLRNDLLETFVNWVTELRAMDPRTLRTEEPHMTKLLTDLTISTMRALIQVLDKLPVKPMNNPGPTSANQPSDVRSLRGRAYRRYFDFFVRFMSQCRMVEIQEFSSMTSVHATNTAAAAALDAATGGNTTPANRGRANRSESFVAATTDVGVGRDIARNIYGSSAASTGSSVPPLPNVHGAHRFNRELSQNAELLLNISIKALTNMLAANLEIGLQYSLTIIYHEDTKLRALFTDMFTTILNEGIDIDSLGGDTPEHWKSRLVETLIDPNLKLLLGINELCQVQDIDELGAALINIFEARNQTRILFERVITVELERTDSASELFRRNCLATRLLSYYAKLHGDAYLKSTLVPAIRKLLAQPPGTLTFELNPNKMTESADRDRNLKNVERLCSLVIDAIVSSVNNLPSTLRWICNLIYRIVITRFPDAGYTAVGGFVFLRFLCPAIVAPDSHGICSQITNSEVRRGLLLCTKITHNLANDILFGNKETYMVPLNKFISENRTRTMNFLSEIAELTDDTESIFDGTAKSIASSTGASSALPVGRPSTEYGGSSEADIEVNTTDSTGVSTKDFVAVQRFIFDHLDRLDTYLAREPMVRLHVQQKPNEKRKSTHARTAAANAASAAALGSVAGNGISPTASAIPVGASGQSETPAGSNGAVTLAKAANAEAATAGEITSTENLFTQVSYIMRQLGPPPAPADKSQPKAAVVAEPVNTTSTTGSEEMFYDILRRDVGRNTDAIAKKAIIYVGGLSREKRPVIYVIARRLQMQYLDMESVMLHTLRILEPLATKGFEVFFDLTQFGPANEVPMQWLRQLKRILPETIINNIQSVYWYNVNTHFRKYVKQGNLNLPPRMARRSVFPHSLSDLHEFLASPQADLPPGTVSLDNESGINISPVSRVSRSHPPLPCVVKVTPEAVQITALRRQEVFSLSTYFNDVYHVTEIADLQLIPNSDFSIMPDPDPETPGKNRGTLHRTASRSSESDRASGTRGKGDEQLVLIRFEGTNASITFSSPKWELLYKAIRSARSRYSNHPNAPAMQERVIRPADVPGTLLNVALLNCGAENATLRISAYRMLISVVATFNMDVGHELAFATDLCLPPNPLQFIFRICTRLSISAPDMTLELLSEALLAFTKCAANMKPWILHYMQPWLLCLGQFTHDTVSHPDALSRTQDIIRSLIRLHLKEPTMYMHFKEHVWSLLARVEELTDIVLDILVTVALEYGALTVETELIADMLATLAGKNPRYNKLVVRLRKLVAQTCTMSVVHISSHQLWPEIAVYMRLLLTTSFSNSNLAEEYLPDVAFVTCMLLKSGPGLIHATLHGIVMHVVHSLALTQCNGMIIDQTFSSTITGANSFAGNPVRQLKESNDAVGAEGGNGSLLLSSYAQLAQQLAELIQKKTKFNFGLRAKSTSAVTFIASSYTRGGAASTLNPEALMEFKDELGTNGPALESPREALAGVERVAQIFLRIMENPAFTSGRGNSWRARWTTLVTASTFVFNPAIQPRAFVLLGKLAAHDEVDDDLLYQTLATLRGALASFGETDESLPISVLICLVNMVGNLPPDSSYLASLFWVGIGVMQIGHLPLYKVGLSLMSKVIRTLDACGAFLPENGDGFQHFLMSARVAVEKASDQIDDVVGISFRYSFSAALSLLLLRGMEDMSTKDEAYEVILQIIGIVANCRKWQQADTANPDRKFDLILPYLILIIPTASVRKELVHVFSTAGYSITADTKSSLERGGYVRLLEQTHKNDIARKCQSDYILYPSILSAMLQSSRAEQEIMILYSLLASKIAWVDSTMSLLVMESLAPVMSSAIHNSHSSKLIHKLHDVMVRLAITRPHFDPDVFIQQQSLLHNGANLADIAHGLTVDAVAATTRKSVSAAVASSNAAAAAAAAAAYSALSPVSPSPVSSSIAGHRISNAPPARNREDSSERTNMLHNAQSQETMSMLSKQSSTHSIGNQDTSFERSMVPAHREYMGRIGFGGMGRVIVFGGSITQWRELAELASLVVDQML
ncbi:Ras GTPase activating protein ira2 [Coemansia umbellata]|uniref:Ras GTPase activating protein ira2 n=1 Tax=Coemansia umbellata TaxID=1424467 RepID=A0ABQ8PHL4_9FUNG|nr:Ras GTPase activating protein ira2 [Coemansia umbellata]